MLNFDICERGPVSKFVCDMGISEFSDLTCCIRNIPYGRTVSSDPLSVLKEKRGTCSSKHRLLKAIAEEHRKNDIDLVVGLYMMCEANTPGVGNILDEAGIRAIPEAHCYLKYQGQRYDETGLHQAEISPFDSLISEHITTSADILFFKRTFHRKTIACWAEKERLSFSCAWALREKCIQALSA